MTDNDFAYRALRGTGQAARKREAVRGQWSQIMEALARGSSFRSIHRTLRNDGHDVGSFTGFLNNVRHWEDQGLGAVVRKQDVAASPSGLGGDGEVRATPTRSFADTRFTPDY